MFVVEEPFSGDDFGVLGENSSEFSFSMEIERKRRGFFKIFRFEGFNQGFFEKKQDRRKGEIK